MTPAPTPSPPDLLFSLFIGLFAGLGLGLVVFLGMNVSWQAALLFAVVAVVLGTAQHVLGGLILMLPVRAVQAVWRLITNTPKPPPPAPKPPVKRHWISVAAFWAGLVLTPLLIFYAELREKVS